MSTVILAIIDKLNSSVALLLLILLAVFFVLFKVGYWAHKLTAQDGRLDKVEGLAERVVALSTKVDLIYQIVNPNSPTRAGSPVKLTPVGEEIIVHVQAHTVLQKYLHRLVAEVERKEPQNAYDVQMASFDTAKGPMVHMLDEEELVRMKDEAVSRGILLEDVMSVFGILLRNHVLTAKGMSIADVDTNDPAQKE